MSLKSLLKRGGKSLLGRLATPPASVSPALWNLHDAEGKLALHGVTLESLLESFGSPLHVLDVDSLEKSFGEFAAPPPSSPLRHDVFLSYKTNCLPFLLRHLHSRGAGAEVISDFELWLALELGVSPRRIVVNGPGKTDSYLERAIASEVLVINVNHLEEVERIAAVAARLGKRARVGIRGTVPGAWSEQLGIPLHSETFAACCRKIAAHPQLMCVGLHSHRGRLHVSAQEYRSYLEQVLAGATEMARHTGTPLSLIDFGGSFPVPTVAPFPKNEQRLARTLDLPPAGTLPSYPRPEEFIAELHGAVSKWLEGSRQACPQLIIEPGRGLTGHSQMLLGKIISTNEAGQRKFAIADFGVNHAEIMCSEIHRIFPLRKKEDEEKTYRLTGPLCHVGDTLCMAWRTPALEAGDGVAVMDSGAYFMSQSNSFSFPRPGIVALGVDGKARLIQAHESFAQIIARDSPS